MKSGFSKKTNIIFTILGLLVVSYLLLSVLNEKKYSDKKIQENFKTGFLKQKDLLENEFIKQYNQIDETNAQLIFKNISNDYLSFQAFINDSIISWSSNTVLLTPDTSVHDTFFVTKLDNGIYQIIQRSKDEITLIGLNLIKYDYPISNEHLLNSFNPAYQIPGGIKAEIKINTPDIESDIPRIISHHQSNDVSEKPAILFFIIFVVIYALILLSLYKLYRSFTYFKNKFLWFIILFSVDVIIIRLIIYYFNIPYNLQNTSFFNPTYFASTIFLNSLGDLLLNAISIFAISLVFLKHFQTPTKQPLNTFSGYFKVFSILFHFFIFFKLIDALFKFLIFDSNFSLELSNIFALSIPSYFSILSLFLILISYVIVGIKLFDSVFPYLINQKKLFYISLLLAFSVSITFLFLRNHNIINSIIPLLFILILTFQKLYFKNFFNNFTFISLIFFFSMVSAYKFFHNNQLKEKQNRQLLAVKISNSADPLSEYLFNQKVKYITEDSVLNHLSSNSMSNPEFLDSISLYLNKKYFDDIFRGYSKVHTLCTDDQLLIIQPDDILTNCYDYFDNQINTYCDSTFSSNLFRYNFSDAFSYISKIRLPGSQKFDSKPLTLFSEFYYKNLPDEGLGYPELLVDQNANLFPDLSSYSYSRYNHGKLFYKYGDFDYCMKIDSALTKSYFINEAGYNHFYYPINQFNTLIISMPVQGALNFLASFSYLFISFTILTILILMFFFSKQFFKSASLNFSNRLQLIIISIVIFIFIFEGILSIYYIKQINADKNIDILKEKTHSVLIELEHKLSNEKVLNEDLQEYLSDLLYKFSLVFFSDINLYDLSGRLLATSRPEIFNEGLTSILMNPSAYDKLHNENQLLFIHEEKIGSHLYLSAYMPFRNSDNEISAYLNLPYFSKQSELREEIATFLTTFLNIYILFIVLSIILSFIISKYTLQPLKILQTKIAQLTLLKTNEKISWKSKDEIGKLVEEYNRMVEELESSALLLAQSERESAWREMAKQVAHEIKNPLTPMKLSVQSLQKSWDDNSPEFSYRLKRFTKTIVDQIDELSAIASEFSDFAKMPLPKVVEFDVLDSVKSVIDLYKHSANIKFELSYDKQQEYPVKADKKLISRAFSNLIKNSVQALECKDEGHIHVSLIKTTEFIEIIISDDGPGISKEITHKIFSPNFTTKSGGMGLGLAMVKNIVDSYSGSIQYHSQEGIGTTFKIKLPLNKS